MPRGGKRPGAGRKSRDSIAAVADPKAYCDQAIQMAAECMVASGAPIDMILDRLLTYAGAQACSMNGSPATAKVFRVLANNIEAGAFHSITGEGARH